MRKLILDRIEQIRRSENNFNRSVMRWGRPLTNGTDVKYADEINFEELNDTDLLFLFERLIRRVNMQM
jgi:hypothetical protein